MGEEKLDAIVKEEPKDPRIVEDTPTNAAAAVARRYIVEVEQRRNIKNGRPLHPKDVKSAESKLVEIAHVNYEHYGDRFLEELRAQHPQFWAKAFHHGSSHYQH